MEGIDPTRTRARLTDERDPEPIAPKAGPKYDELPPDLVRRVADDRHLIDMSRRVREDLGAGKLDDSRYLGPAIERPTLVVDGIRPTDVVQGSYIGDCTVEASLASVARTEHGQAWLKSRMSENLAPDGSVASYSVKLKIQTPAGVFEDKSVLVYPSELSKLHSLQSDAAGNTEVWPLVWEAAIAKAVGGFEVLAKGSNVPRSSAVITGKPAVDVAPKTEPNFESKLVTDFAAGKLQVLSTAKQVHDGDIHLPGAHAFTVVDVRELQLVKAKKDGDPPTYETLVFVRNPWGTGDPPRGLTMAEAKEYFAAYSAGDVP